MIEALQRYLKGWVRIRLEGGSYERFLNLLSAKEIDTWDLLSVDGGYELSIRLCDVRKLKDIRRKCSTRIKIVKKSGFPFFLHTYRRRKFLAAGALFGFLLMFFLSSFIWNIEVSGNLGETDETVFAYLKSEGVFFGAKKSTLDCKELQAKLRQEFPDFIWVSARLVGTSLFIDVEENAITDPGQEQLPVSSLQAERGGTVVSIVTRKGTPLVKAGDRVEKGEILVSSALPIYNDSQELEKTEYCAADADIFLRTVYEYQDSFPLQYQKKVYTGREEKDYFIRIFNGIFRLAHPDTAFSDYDTMTESHQLGFSRYFKLPLFVGQRISREYRMETFTYTGEEAEREAARQIQANLQKIQDGGAEIEDKQIEITVTGKECRMEGTVTLIQKTGKRVTEIPIEG